MKRKPFEFFVLFLLVICSCEDILEEPDISDQTIELLAPLEGSIVNINRINFNWVGLVDASSYQLQIAQPNFVNANQVLLDSVIVQDSTGILSTSVRNIGLLNGNYAWRIKAINGGFESKYAMANFTVAGDENVDFDAPNTPILSEPQDGSTSEDTTVIFRWSREDMAGSPERDSIYVFTDESLQTLELKGLGANKEFTAELTANTYYWFVRAFDADGNQSGTPTAFSFTVN